MRYVGGRDPLWGRFHATGVMLYGKEWDKRRHALASLFTGGREATSTRMYPDEMVKACDHMDKLIESHEQKKEKLHTT